jgi:hypothetical protein
MIVLYGIWTRSLAQAELAGVVAAAFVACPFPERHQERLGHQVVGGLAADPAGQIAVNVRRVSVEERREPVGGSACDASITAASSRLSRFMRRLVVSSALLANGFTCYPQDPPGEFTSRAAGAARSPPPPRRRGR